MKYILILLFSSTLSISSIAQDHLKTLETKAETTKTDYGVISIPFANAILDIADEQIKLEQWSKVLESIERANKIAFSLERYITSLSDRTALQTLNTRVQVCQYKYDLLQKKAPTRCFGLHNVSAWHLSIIKEKQTALIIELIQFSFVHFSAKSTKGILHWQQAYKAAQNINDTPFTEQLWSILQVQLKKEFGENSNEYVGALFAQTNYYRRTNNSSQVAIYQQKVEAYWGKVDWGISPISMNDVNQGTKTFPTVQTDSTALLIAEQMPLFLGDKIQELETGSIHNNRRLSEFITNSIVYPADVIKSGVVRIAYVVEKEGYLSNIAVLSSPHKKLSLESLRVITRLNEYPFRFTPGQNSGKKVRIKWNIPIKFRRG